VAAIIKEDDVVRQPRLSLCAGILLLATSNLAAATAQRTFVASSGVDNPTCSLGTPCRSFAAAVTATDPAGEVIVVDSAGYGPVTSTRPVSIIAPPGIYGGISVLPGNDCVTIDAPGSTVVLRGLSINGQGGVVNQMIGDGLRAIFGAPLPLDDHAGSAVAAALDMVEMIELFGVERREAGRAPIRIGIGIASGDLVAGYTGTQERATYTCIGDTVNLAARLETHTKVAQRAILVDPAVRAALGDAVAAESLGPVAFRGKAAPVEVFAIR
jgi:hypothetical protein